MPRGSASLEPVLLIANCDEFIYYDDLIRAAEKRKKPAAKKGKQE